MAITASFSGSTLSTIGDALDNSIVFSRNAAGGILVNGGAVAVTGGTPTVANTSLIEAFGLSSQDTISLDERSAGRKPVRWVGRRHVSGWVR